MALFQKMKVKFNLPNGTLEEPKQITYEILERCNDKSITEYIVNDGCKVINERAFEGCIKLESITLPKSLKQIGESAFEGCVSLKEITLPAGLKYIGDAAFFSCQKLKKVEFEDNNDVATIGKHAFAHCYNLREFTFLQGITRIEEGTFSDCRSLRKLNNISQITQIGDKAFFDCPLENLPEEFINLNPNAFEKNESREDEKKYINKKHK